VYNDCSVHGGWDRKNIAECPIIDMYSAHQDWLVFCTVKTCSGQTKSTYQRLYSPHCLKIFHPYIPGRKCDVRTVEGRFYTFCNDKIGFRVAQHALL
jgi:hypothetical protein